jgi:hypothetical protein
VKPAGVSGIKKREYLKDKINGLATDSKNKSIRGPYRRLNNFKRGYQPRSKVVKDKNGHQLADSHNILNRWRKTYSQLLKAHRVSDVKQVEVPAEPLVPYPSPFEVEIAVAKFKKYKSPGSDQIPAELVQAGDETLQSEIHKLINSIWSKENCLISGRCILLYQFTRRVIKLTVVIIVGYHCYQLHTKFYLISFSQG